MFFHEISISCWTNRFELNAKKYTHTHMWFLCLAPRFDASCCRCLSTSIGICMGIFVLFFFCCFLFTAFNWRQFMGNNFMACSEASNFDAIIIAPIYFVLHRFIALRYVLSLKSISLPVSSHITMPICVCPIPSLRPPPVPPCSFIYFPLNAPHRTTSHLGLLFGSLVARQHRVYHQLLLLLSLSRLLVTIFSVTLIFIAGFTKLNCHPFYNVMDAIF